MSSFHRCGFASGRSRWLRRKILLLPIFQSLIDGADLPDGAEELFATSIALDGHLHAPTRNSAALKSVRLFDNHRLTRGIQRQLMTYIMALKNIETLACLGAQLVTLPQVQQLSIQLKSLKDICTGKSHEILATVSWISWQCWMI